MTSSASSASAWSVALSKTLHDLSRITFSTTEYADDDRIYDDDDDDDDASFATAQRKFKPIGAVELRAQAAQREVRTDCVYETDFPHDEDFDYDCDYSAQFSGFERANKTTTKSGIVRRLLSRLL